MKLYTNLVALLLSGSLMVGCGPTSLVLTPVANIDVIPKKVSELTSDERKSWGHADLIADTIPGMSLNKAYKEIIKKVII